MIFAMVNDAYDLTYPAKTIRGLTLPFKSHFKFPEFRILKNFYLVSMETYLFIIQPSRRVNAQ